MFRKPDFTKSNLNISATLAEFLHAPNKNAKLPLLEATLKKGFEKVVFVCFDGMGIFPMRQNLPKTDFLWKHTKAELLSTFPSTTTNATTSLITNTLPLEHGWFGWSLPFDAIGDNVDVFLGKSSWTGEAVDTSVSPLENFPYYFDCAQTDYRINTVFPHFVKPPQKAQNYVFSGMEEFFACLQQVCSKEGKQFVYAYCTEPDSTMHEYGVTSAEAKSTIEKISQGMQQLAKSCHSTLFVVTADHGQIDVEGSVELFNDKKLMDMLKTYPYMEARAVAFRVKDGCKEQFEQHFNATYGKDFVLKSSAELVKQGYFGSRGNKAHLLGDFVAIGAETHKVALMTPIQVKLQGHHTSLTEEMDVPLILVECL